LVGFGDSGGHGTVRAVPLRFGLLHLAWGKFQCVRLGDDRVPRKVAPDGFVQASRPVFFVLEMRLDLLPTASAALAA
jgi:hypothetical protein